MCEPGQINDVDPKLKKLFLEKQKLRAAAKQYFRKFIDNPYNKNGHPFDPVLHRFSAMSAHHMEIWKPTPKTWFKFGLFLLPFYLTYEFLNYSRRGKEEMIRNGLVRYEDREYRFLF